MTPAATSPPAQSNRGHLSICFFSLFRPAEPTTAEFCVPDPCHLLPLLHSPTGVISLYVSSLCSEQPSQQQQNFVSLTPATTSSSCTFQQGSPLYMFLLSVQNSRANNSRILCPWPLPPPSPLPSREMPIPPIGTSNRHLFLKSFLSAMDMKMFYIHEVSLFRLNFYI